MKPLRVPFWVPPVLFAVAMPLSLLWLILLCSGLVEVRRWQP